MVLEPIVALSTLSAAVSIWFGELRQDWENNLPKRLNVIIQFQGKNRLVCTGLRLIGENDIRALSQQIGRQMNSNNDLKFDPFIEQTSRIITPRNKKNFNDFKLYIAKFSLNKDVTIDHGSCLYWSYDVSGKKQQSCLAASGKNTDNHQKYQQNITIVLRCCANYITLPMKVKRQHCTRAEVQGLLGAIYQDQYNIPFLASTTFFNRLELVQKGESDCLCIDIDQQSDFDVFQINIAATEAKHGSA